MNDRLRVLKVSWKFGIPTIYIFCSNLPLKFANFLKEPIFSQFLLSFLFINKSLRLNNLKTRTAINAKISVFVIFIEAIMYFLLYNLLDFTSETIGNEIGIKYFNWT